jgi:MFS family permease
VSTPPWRNRTVLALGLVSLLTDASGEMIAPLLPLFVTTTLGGGAISVGAIDGFADASASILKFASGRLADRFGRWKTLALVGYGISSASRPLVALATSPVHVLLVRVADRIGKGIRTSPRDTWLAAAVPKEQRGSAFGFHRGMDHVGAIIGPLLALAGLASGLPLRTVFWLGAIPGALAWLALWLAPAGAEATSPSPGPLTAPPPRLRKFLAPLGLFSLGKAAEGLLLLRAVGTDRPLEIPLVWIGYHVIKVATSEPLGRLSDRLGRRGVLLAGWALYALVAAGLAFATGPLAIALFAVYALYDSLTDGVATAWVSELVEEQRGTAFGWFHLVSGLAAVPAGLGLGALWSFYGPESAFLASAAVTGAASVWLAIAAI